MISDFALNFLISIGLSGFLHPPVFNATLARNLVTCKAIARTISPASEVFYPGSLSYDNDVSHWLPSSSQLATCSVEPGTSQDVAAILKVLGNTDTPFAIKSAGHGTNKGSSSTTGVHIAMSRFNTVSYNKDASTATIGTGLSWDQVYQHLGAYNATVAGGRIKGVGVGGFILGGGYSWISNKRGLGIDTVVSFELVLPNGKIVNVSKSSYPDLFFGLKGGFNNFGIMTRVTMQTFYQGPVWYKSAAYYGDSIPKVLAAMSTYDASPKDPDGAVLVFGQKDNNTYSLALLAFYNGPEPPAGTFATFEDISASVQKTSVTGFADFIIETSGATSNDGNLRGTFNSVQIPVESVAVLTEILNQGKYYSGPGSFANDTLINFTIESFVAESIERPLRDSAWPRPKYAAPLNLYYAWYGEENDAAGIQAIKNTAAAIKSKMIQGGQNVADFVLYPNYALPDASIESLYGPNTGILKNLRRKWDPTGVMLRAGGFKLV